MSTSTPSNPSEQTLPHGQQGRGHRFAALRPRFLVTERAGALGCAAIVRRGPDVDGGLTARLIDALDDAPLIAQTRQRVRSSRSRRDNWSGTVTGGSFLVVTFAWLISAQPNIAAATMLGCVVAHTLASSVEFELGPGVALPSTPVLVAELFLLPPPVVPLAALAGLCGAAWVAQLRDPSRRERPLVTIGNAWHAVGPAVVVAVLGPLPQASGALGVVALAVLAQLAFDAAFTLLHNCLGLHIEAGAVLRALRFTFAVDVLLAPLGVVAALASPGTPLGLLWLAPPIGLLALLSYDRRRRIDTALLLGRAVTEAATNARRDPLTGLANRLAWEERLMQLAEARTPIGVLLADIDGLKVANDTMGHDMGDRLIATVAELLAGHAPEGDVLVARLGGDEFGMLVDGADATTIDVLADGVRAALAAHPPLDGVLAISASIGASTAGSGAGLAEALRQADRNVYQDKRTRNVARR